jgi:cation diffusion facilitator family transporter
MHRTDVSRWQHDHDYLPEGHRRGEQQTRRVIALTASMMVVEIVAGSLFGSMALLADGWHMASHASALGITAFAYAYARRHAGDSRYSFGTWKVGVLGGYTSAVTLAVIAALIAWESFGRILEPVAIRFDEAIAVAWVGLAVNLVSAWMLRDDPHHGGHDPAHPAHHHDHNLRGAYLHVLADALTSGTAILALTAGKYLGWVWMDPAMGVVGSLVIARWSYGLLRDSSGILLDGAIDEDTASRVREALESDGDAVATDLHIWKIGPSDCAAAISVVADHPRPPDEYRRRIAAAAPSVSHVTLEVNRCAS